MEQTGRNSCSIVPENGFFKRSNEQSVLPHAIGCQLPTPIYEDCENLVGLSMRPPYGIQPTYRSEYTTVLQGDRMTTKISFLLQV